MSQKFRKKPIIIEAEQYFFDQKPYPKGVIANTIGSVTEIPHVKTLNGALALKDGDWIIPEPDGVHYYPCKPDVFAAMYEPVPTDNDASKA